MTVLERVIKVVDWLIFDGKIKNRRDLAEKLGYTESSLSQILKGDVNLSGRFIKKLSIFDDRINYDWIISGNNSMILSKDIESMVASKPINEHGKSEKQDIPYELYKLTLENEKLTKEKELELIKQNGELIELVKKMYNK